MAVGLGTVPAVRPRLPYEREGQSTAQQAPVPPQEGLTPTPPPTLKGPPEPTNPEAQAQTRVSEGATKGNPPPTQTQTIATARPATAAAAAIPGATAAAPTANTVPTARPGPGPIPNIPPGIPNTTPTAPRPPAGPELNLGGGVEARPAVEPTPGTPNYGVTLGQVGTAPAVPAGAPKPEIPLAPTLKSIIGHTAAQQKYESAENEYNRKTYEAALGLGREVPEQQRKAEGSLRTLIGRMGMAGTINSSLNQEGQTLIKTNEDVAVQKAYDLYNTKMREAGDFMTAAREALTLANEERNREEAEKAEARMAKTAGPEPPEVTKASIQYPGAMARVQEAFPGGLTEQRKWIKEQALKNLRARGQGGSRF